MAKNFDRWGRVVVERRREGVVHGDLRPGFCSGGEAREAVVVAGKRRARPCLMTTATTLLALLPVITSTGRGADVMLPMALPVFGGMTVALGSLFLVPALFAWREEWALTRRREGEPMESRSKA